jgi:hypothetical protein
MIVNKIKNNSVVELTTKHSLDETCKCSPSVSVAYTKKNNGYAQYGITKTVVHN